MEKVQQLLGTKKQRCDAWTEKDNAILVGVKISHILSCGTRETWHSTYEMYKKAVGLLNERNGNDSLRVRTLNAVKKQYGQLCPVHERCYHQNQGYLRIWYDFVDAYNLHGLLDEIDNCKCGRANGSTKTKP